jgi:hypothetical protein
MALAGGAPDGAPGAEAGPVPASALPGRPPVARRPDRQDTMTP